MFVHKVLFSLVFGLALVVIANMTSISQEYGSRKLALEQVKNPSEVTEQAYRANSYFKQTTGFVVGYILVNLLIFYKEMKLGMRKLKQLMLGMFFVGILCSTGCMMPYHEEVYVDVSTNETPFFIEMKGDNEQATVQTEEFLKSKMVFMRRITVPYDWKQTTRVYFWNDWTTGRYVPVARLILVDRSPVTRNWNSENGSNQAIWVESKDSIGFSTGITITARIANDDDAVKFLFNYPPKDGRNIETSGGDPFVVNVTSLESIMDSEIRSLIQASFAEEAAALEMDALRESKAEIITKIKSEVVPFFKERGITITNLGQFGGFTYENAKTQEAIDKVFQAQQDQEVAKAEARAAEERKIALKLLGEGEAGKALEISRGKADAIKLEADAKAYEVEKLTANSDSYIKLKQFEIELKRIEKWKGEVPGYLIDSQGLNSFLPLPTTTK